MVLLSAVYKIKEDKSLLCTVLDSNPFHRSLPVLIYFQLKLVTTQFMYKVNYTSIIIFLRFLLYN